MDREKQIEEMAKILCVDYGECEHCICNRVESDTDVCTVKSDCEELYDAGYRKPDWISVDYDLPNVHRTASGYESVGVIACIEGEHNNYTGYRIYERACFRGKTVYRWKFPWERISDEKITHWMPLPEPPKGE